VEIMLGFAAAATASALLTTHVLPARPAVGLVHRSSVLVASEGGLPDINWLPPIDPQAGDVEAAEG